MRKPALLRWTVGMASAEFDLDPKTLRKRLRAAGITAGDDGRYSTAQLVQAVSGDLRYEQTRETRARADRLEMELAKERGEVIHRERVFQFLENIFIAVKMKILGSSLSELEKEKILNDLVGLRDADL